MKHAATFAANISALALSAVMLASPAIAQAKDKKPPFARPQQASSFPQAERDYDAVFSGRPAVQRIRVPGSLFISEPLNDMAPSSLLAKHVDIDIRTDVPTLSDLQTLLEIQGVNISIDYNSLYEAQQTDSTVGSFTAASKYQGVANSVSGGTGVQDSGFGGGFGGGFDDNGFGRSGGGSSDANVTVEGAAGDTGSQAAPVAATIDDNGSSPAFINRILPFRNFRGTVGELMRQLENTGNIAVWYQNGLVVGGTRRYSVSLLQQQDIVQSVVNELQKLGASNVVGSVGAGQVFYSAPPRTNNEIVEPYLRRMSGNMSEVTLQVALVTVQMSRAAERGFDWSAFNFGLGQNVTNLGTDGGQIGGGVIDGGDGGAGGGTTATLQNGAFTINNSAFNANLGDVFGINRLVSVAGAIQFLSRIGNTSVAQNVELRTLSGSPVILRSGEDIPYVSGVGSTQGGGLSGNTFGSSQTARLGTGLTLNVDPRYDHTSGIVTMDIGLKLVDLVEFVQLNAGNQLGTLTQPRTREQGVNSILRIPAGQTSILGGIRREFTADQKTGPFGLFGIGSRDRQSEVFWLFAIVRPVVTVYETADSPVAPRSVLDTRTTVNPYDEGSYGVNGQPGAAVPLPADRQTTQDGGTPTYYGQGGYTPANRQPAGVTTAAVPAPRGIVVPGAGTSPEVNANIPQGAVLRDPGGPGPGNDVDRSRTPTPTYVGPSGAVVIPAPAYPVPAPGAAIETLDPGASEIPYAGELPDGGAVPVIQGVPVTDPSTQEAVNPAPEVDQPRRSFLRPMTTTEKAE